MATSVVSTGDGFTVSSSHEDGAAMLESLGGSGEADSSTPRVLRDKGKDVEQTDEPEKDPIREAASALGKRGGEAAAAKRAADAAAEKKAAKAEGEPDEAPEKKAGNPRHDPKARVEEATRAAREAREEAAQERRERERLSAELARERAARAQPSEEQPEQRRPAAVDDTEPKEEDFEDYAAYVKAVSRHAVQQERRQQAARDRHEGATREVAARMQTFKERLAGVGADDPAHGQRLSDFIAALSPDIQNLKPTLFLANGEQKTQRHVIADEIMASERGRDVMQHLSDHPEEFQRIAALRTSREIARAMAIIEARLDHPEAATAGTSSGRETSKAKPPVRPVTGSPHAAGAEPDPETSSFDEHYRFYSSKRGR